jgi:hypothetical protein
MRNRINVLESAVAYCLTTIKELESYIETQAEKKAEVEDAQIEVIDSEEVKVE